MKFNTKNTIDCENASKMISLNHNNIPKPVEATPNKKVKFPYPCIEEPASVYKKNNNALLILFTPEPYNIIMINKIGNTLSKNI